MTEESDGRVEFFRALRARELDRLRALAAAEPAVVFAIDPQHCCGGTAMNTAVAFGDPELLDTLLELGADPNQPSDWPPGPFQALHSIPMRYLDTLGPFLIQRGAAIDAHAASKLGMLAELRTLVESDPEVVHRKGPDGQRPLHFSRTPEIARFLLDMGSDIEAVCVDHGSTAAEWAAAERPDVCRFLLERGARGDEFMYVMIGDTDRLEAAIAEDPAVLHARTTPDRFRPTDGEAAHIYMYSIGSDATLLHAAATTGRTDMASLLLDAGVDPNARGGYDDQTPAHGAAWHNHADIIALLAAGGADVNLPSGQMHRNPPVGWAILNGSLEAIEALLDAGAEILDHYIQDAERGIEGGWRDFSATPPERYEAIRHLLAARRSA
ncbi:MAG: ankyrin repeat domain-containing protein [Gemmatimonadota bacterium]|nr:ankyrin repeat domain-containing protein [Gemmatimonadota bacterium]